MNTERILDIYIDILNKAGGIEASFASKRKGAPFNTSSYYHMLTKDEYMRIVTSGKNVALLNGLDLAFLPSDVLIDSGKAFPVRSSDTNKRYFTKLTYDFDFKGQIEGFEKLRARQKRKAVQEYFDKELRKQVEGSHFVSMVNNTIGGLHVDIFLESSVKISNVEEYKALYLSLGEFIEKDILQGKIKFDRSCANPARIFRAPFSINYKYDEGLKCEVLFLKDGIYSDKEFFDFTNKNKAKLKNKKEHDSQASISEGGLFERWAARVEVKDGKRNDTLTFICREGLARGISSETLEKVTGDFQKRNDKRDDPFSIDEAMAVLRYQEKYHKGDPFKSKVDISDEFEFVDVANYYFETLVDRGSWLVFFREKFYQYNGKYYNKMSLKIFEVEILRWLQANPELKKFCKKRSVDEIVENLKALTSHPNEMSLQCKLGEKISTGLSYLNLNNGTLRIEWKEDKLSIDILPHSKDFFFDYVLDYDYDPNAKCSEFLKTIQVILPDSKKLELTQEMFGYSITTSTEMESFFVLVGVGANGKGVIRVILGELVGSQNIANLSPEDLNGRRPFLVSLLEGKLVNFPTESKNLGSVDVAILKKIASGEFLTGEKKYFDPYEFAPFCTMIISTNAIPSFKDDSDGVKRRFQLITLDQKFTEENRDIKLRTPNYWKESGELSGILNWSLEGLRRVVKNKKFTEPEGAKDQIDQYMKIGNPINAFFDDFIEEANGEFLYPGQIYWEYRQFCEEMGVKPVNQMTLTQKVKERFNNILQEENPTTYICSVRKEKKRQRKLVGIALKTNELRLVSARTAHEESNSISK